MRQLLPQFFGDKGYNRWTDIQKALQAQVAVGM